MFHDAVLIVPEGDVDYGYRDSYSRGRIGILIYIYIRGRGMLFMLRLLFQKEGRHVTEP